MADYIKCDFCGYWDFAENFPDWNTEMGRAILRKNGLDMDNFWDRSQVQTMFAGYVCPGCGNYSSFDSFSYEESSDDLEGVLDKVGF